MAAAIAHGLGRDNGYIGEEAVAENREQQAIEVETLRSIYGDEVTVITEGTEYLVKVTPNLDADVQRPLLPLLTPSLKILLKQRLPDCQDCSPSPISLPSLSSSVTSLPTPRTQPPSSICLPDGWITEWQGLQWNACIRCSHPSVQ
jgi:hypothetical protein